MAGNGQRVFRHPSTTVCETILHQWRFERMPQQTGSSARIYERYSDCEGQRRSRIEREATARSSIKPLLTSTHVEWRQEQRDFRAKALLLLALADLRRLKLTPAVRRFRTLGNGSSLRDCHLQSGRSLVERKPMMSRRFTIRSPRSFPGGCSPARNIPKWRRSNFLQRSGRMSPNRNVSL
jgi:hypothetical protein